MSAFLHDLLYAYRTLRKSRGFTAVAVATLAIGIGANTAIFSFVNGVLLKPLPYAEPERIVRVLEKPPGGDRNGISTLNYLDWAHQNSVFEFMSAERGTARTLTGVDEPVQLSGMRVGAHYFDIFRVKMELGRTFAEGEDEEGKDHVVVLSYALWRRQFGEDRSILGRSLILDGESYTVIGVLGKGSAFDRSWAGIWTPLTFTAENRTRNFHWMGSTALLKRGVTIEQARAQMDTIGARIAADYPDSNKGWGVVVDPYASVVVGKKLRQSIYVLLATVGMVLLIACANLANLTLARGLAREREVTIRAALGATRWQLIRLLLTESLLLSIAGGVLGLLVGYVSLVVLKLALPDYMLPQEAQVEMDGGVLLFTFGLALLTGMIFGLAPALHAAKHDLTTGVKEGGTGGNSGRAGRGLRSALVIAEIALAFVLLTGAGLLLRSFNRIENVDPGFDATNVLTARFPIAEKQFPDFAALSSYLELVTEKLRALPGVREVALTSALPMTGWGYGMPFQRSDQPEVDRSNRKACFFKMVSPSYFSALKMKLIKGRTLTAKDTKGAPPVTVISQSMAKKFFADEDPIGKQILIQEIILGRPQLGDEIPWEVVGVIGNECVGELNDKPEKNPGVYVPLAQSLQQYQSLLIRADVDPTLLQHAMKDALHAVNKNQTLTEIKTLDQIKTQTLGDTRLRTRLLAVFATIALVLAALGIYGVMSYHVAQRTREIGIRTALGANAKDILKLVFRSGISMVALGLALGLSGIIALTRFLASFLFEVGERDPLTISLVAALLGAIALIACYVPSRRAAKVDPLLALRTD